MNLRSMPGTYGYDLPDIWIDQGVIDLILLLFVEMNVSRIEFAVEKKGAFDMRIRPVNISGNYAVLPEPGCYLIQGELGLSAGQCKTGHFVIFNNQLETIDS